MTTAAVDCQRCLHQERKIDANVQAELEAIKSDMKKANATIGALQEREKKMKERLVNQAHKMVERQVVVSGGGGGGKFETAAEVQQATALVRSYGNLYAQSRLETLDWLDQLG